jgi:hypothetical protein
MWVHGRFANEDQWGELDAGNKGFFHIEAQLFYFPLEIRHGELMAGDGNEARGCRCSWITKVGGGGGIGKFGWTRVRDLLTPWLSLKTLPND